MPESTAGRSLTGEQRVIAACEHRATDRVPVYHASISSRCASVLLGREAFVGGGIQQWREADALWRGADEHREFLDRTRRDTMDVARALDTDLVRVSFWRMQERPTRRVDDYTFLYGDPDGDYRVMRLDPDTELYQTVDQRPVPDPGQEDLEAEVAAAEQALDSYRPTSEGFPDILAGLREFEGERAIPGAGVGIGVQYRSAAWIEMVAARPDLIERWLDVQAEMAVRNVRAQAGLNVRVMLGGGDLATNLGPIYSPKAFRELLMPRLRRIVDACHECGKYYFFASDGDLWPIANDLFDAVDGYYEIDRRAGMDLALLRELYPTLTLIGNISSHTLHLGKEREVVEETLSCIEVAREHGSVIVGCSNLIVSQTPEENLMAMVETLREHR